MPWASIGPHQINQIFDIWKIPAASSVGLFLRFCSCGPPLLCKASEGFLSNSGEEKKKALLKKSPKHIPTNASKQIVYMHVKLIVKVA